MKKIISLFIILILLLSLTGCSSSISYEEMEETLSDFMEALKVYDREALTECLDRFPDSSEYVYLDDIYNDEGYMELYRLAFPELTYIVEEDDKNTLNITCTNADIQKLYVNVTAMVLELAISDETLQKKLNEDEGNGILLVRELMLSMARDPSNLQKATNSYTLTFKRKEGKVVIVCNDELRTLITGRFFLSKNMLASDLNR